MYGVPPTFVSGSAPLVFAIRIVFVTWCIRSSPNVITLRCDVMILHIFMSKRGKRNCQSTGTAAGTCHKVQGGDRTRAHAQYGKCLFGSEMLKIGGTRHRYPVSRSRSSPVPEVVAGSGTMQISKIMDAISIFIHNHT